MLAADPLQTFAAPTRAAAMQRELSPAVGRGMDADGHMRVLANVRYGQLHQRADFFPVLARRCVGLATEGAKP